MPQRISPRRRPQHASSVSRSMCLESDARKISLSVFGTLNSGAQALYVCPDPLINANHARINTLALGARLPTIHPFRDYLGTGGFMSYGANNTDLFRRAGDYVDKVLRGAKPADLPIEQPTKFDFIINLTTAKALKHQGVPVNARPRRRGDRMKRRDFITLLGGAAAAWPLAARAQQFRRIGVLVSTGTTDPSYLAAFVQALRKFGWVDGQNLRLDIRWHENDPARGRASRPNWSQSTPT